ncbi:DoxX family protein [Kineococcus radiotolerans]|uniref:DoxX family protein n=1 Tax=Kineococcus radiotolerans (strain ATCC BAA-149 / DSM 14245 / SRS30216) TaxID=266940 RepID=A6WBD5_KINRD|nr:DoxX family protein [Kineococcus radiotolerans]ABS04124.1 DoxX family protein [Kineococcus radiotolerans SRS30216 = ATCC BAA-149]
MNVVLWIVAGLLALAFLGAGLMKLAQPRTKLAASGMAWVEDSSDGKVKAIGALEVLGALGLILPAALGTATILTPLAAAGLAIVMLGAVVVHARRGESKALGGPLVLGVLALVLAILRFGPYSF